MPPRTLPSVQAGAADLHWICRAYASAPPEEQATAQGQGLLMANLEGSGHTSPVLLGTMDYFERQMGRVGFFQPIAGPPYPHSRTGLPSHIELMRHVFQMQQPGESMYGITIEEATKNLASGRTDDILDLIFRRYESYKANFDMVVLEGVAANRAGLDNITELNAKVAAAIDTPVLMVLDGSASSSVMQLENTAVIAKKSLEGNGAEVLGLLVNKLEPKTIADTMQKLQARLAKKGLPLAGGLPFDPILRTIRLDELRAAVGGRLLYGQKDSLDAEVTAVRCCVAEAAVKQLSAAILSDDSQPSLSRSLAHLLHPAAPEHIREVSGAAPVTVMPCMLQRCSALSKHAPHRPGMLQTVPVHALHCPGSMLHTVQACSAVSKHAPDCPEYSVGSQNVQELLEHLDGRQPARALVLTSQDRTDLVLSLLAAHGTSGGPHIAGMLLTAGRTPGPVVDRILRSAYAPGSRDPGAASPVDQPLHEVVQAVGRVEPRLLPTSSAKISHVKASLPSHINFEPMAAQIMAPKERKMTPKMFAYQLTQRCLQNPQHIVLPESGDKRVLIAAAEVVRKGLAKITLLGNPETIQAQAAKLGMDISGCQIVDHLNSPELPRYIDELCEARKKKNISREAALDSLTDFNVYGTLMVRCGDADGMVSGATTTTASTIRPALQASAGWQQEVLKSKERPLVSSVFFMCLPDKVLVYGDCAVNVEPNSQDLATIAVTSAETAAAFGIEPRVALLSYSTGASGSGPQVDRVKAAVEAARKLRPDLRLEGPIQYDAAVDPVIAKQKIKGDSEVAGRANVLIFPDLNTGNNTYKAVQQSTGAIAMGPVMQGLRKPVNDLSRGCTSTDIVQTVLVTSVQALGLQSQLPA
eukprot:jgi/Astpho2/462/Aster-03507